MCRSVIAFDPKKYLLQGAGCGLGGLGWLACLGGWVIAVLLAVVTVPTTASGVVPPGAVSVAEAVQSLGPTGVLLIWVVALASAVMIKVRWLPEWGSSGI